MPRIRPFGSGKLFAALALILAGCAGAQPSGTLATPEEAAAIQTLERSSVSAANAVRAIDTARAVALYNLENAHAAAFKGSVATLREGGTVDVQLDVSQGSCQVTSRPLDLMISGPGFFVVKCGNLGDGKGYVRLGSFFVDDWGRLTWNDSHDRPLDPPITVPPTTTTINISTDGRVFVTVAGNTAPQEIGQIQIARFWNPSGLVEMEPNVYQQSETSGYAMFANPGADGAGTLVQGALEMSNVDVDQVNMRLAKLDQWHAALLRALKIPG